MLVENKFYGTLTASSFSFIYVFFRQMAL